MKNVMESTVFCVIDEIWMSSDTVIFSYPL